MEEQANQKHQQIVKRHKKIDEQIDQRGGKTQQWLKWLSNLVNIEDKIPEDTRSNISKGIILAAF